MMAEPAAPMIALVAAATVTIAGYSLGLRADVLLAGFFGSVAAIVLLNSVPPVSGGPAKTALKRLMVALSSAATAGYLAPVVAPNPPAEWVLPTAFVVGAFAMKFMPWMFERIFGKQR